jgi:hypothetical protein
MTAGVTPKQADLWRGTAAPCEGRVGEQSIWAVLYRQGDRLFADELFADLFAPDPIDRAEAAQPTGEPPIASCGRGEGGLAEAAAETETTGPD